MFDWLFGRKKEEVELEKPGPGADTMPPVPSTLPQAQDIAEPGTDHIETLALQAPPVDTERLESQLDGLGQQMARLVDQAGRLQEQLDRLDYRTSFGNDQLETLTQHLSDVAGWTGPLDRRLAELVTWAEQSHEELTQLEEGIRKLSRTQFKTNSLAEAQQERLQSALETLQDLATRKQEDIEKARQQQLEAVEAARREARVAMAVNLFPALDGVESALESGRALLRRGRPPTVEPSFLARLAYAFGLRDLSVSRGYHRPVSGRDAQALAAWLDGLELVRERFLALLQAEGIQPIRAAGELFDPHRHVAVEAVERSDAPPGTVVEEHRPGYRFGDRILRYAEVVVVRDGIGPHPQDSEAEKSPAAVSGTSHPEDEPAIPEDESATPSADFRPGPGDASWPEPDLTSSEERDSGDREAEGGWTSTGWDVTPHDGDQETGETKGSEEPLIEEMKGTAESTKPGTGAHPEEAAGGYSESFGQAQGTSLDGIQDSPFDQAQDIPFGQAQDTSFGDIQDSSFDQAQVRAEQDQGDGLLDETPTHAEQDRHDGLAGEMTEDTPSQDTRDGTRAVDPEIEELIARFEARQQARHS